MNNLSFSSLNFVNSEPIEQILNSIFANKYGKRWCWLRNYNKLYEIINISISVFHPFANICLYLVKFKSIQFIGIYIWLVRWMTNMNLIPLEYLVNLNSQSNFKFQGKIKFIAATNTSLQHSCIHYHCKKFNSTGPVL
jgi:hypothetical protein